jgi:uncharacterized protein (DUF1501 family)
MNAPLHLSRRRFLQGSLAAGASAALLPTWLAEMAGAAPLGANDGVLVLVQLGGGNDGLNTVVPFGDSAYYAKRGGVSIAAKDVLAIGNGVGLHPRLTWLKSQFDAGRVAVVQGVGETNADLSHFTATARWMSGDGTEGATGTGWAGRFLDGVPDAPLTGVVVGSSLPLVLRGRNRRATALPMSFDAVIDPGHKDDWVRRSADCIRGMAAYGSALGPWGDALVGAGRSAVDLTGTTKGLYNPKLASGPLAQQMDLCARIVNAGVGTRVLHTSLGSFDHHAGLPGAHAQKLGELDAGLKAFFDRLSPALASRTTVVTYSEFGRRVQANQSQGTDHGTASVLFAMGAAVKGGLYGAAPSLTALDRSGNLVPTVDYRSVYTTVLDTWLRADAKGLLSAGYENLRFLNAPKA